MMSFATSAPPAFTTVWAVRPFGAKVGAVAVLAAFGSQQAHCPCVNVIAGEYVAVCAWAVPPPTTKHGPVLDRVVAPLAIPQPAERLGASNAMELAPVTPFSAMAMPDPEVLFLVESKARLSVPPMLSHVPDVAVQVYSGIEEVGKLESVVTANPEPTMVSTPELPMVKAPVEEMNRYAVLVPADIVAVAVEVNGKTTDPMRTLQGVEAAQPVPAVRTVLEVSVTDI